MASFDVHSHPFCEKHTLDLGSGRAFTVVAPATLPYCQSCRIEHLEAALAGLLKYTDDEFAGDNMPDSPEQAAARALLAPGKNTTRGTDITPQYPGSGDEPSESVDGGK